jgi:hypothetical protein
MSKQRSQLRHAIPDWVADAAVELVNYAVDRSRVDGTRVLGKKDASALFKLIRFWPSPRRLDAGQPRNQLTRREIELCHWLAHKLDEQIERAARQRAKQGDKNQARRNLRRRKIAAPRVAVDWAVEDRDVSTFEEFVAFVASVVNDERFDLGKELCRCRQCGKHFWRTRGAAQGVTRTLCSLRCTRAAGAARTKKSRVPKRPVTRREAKAP